MAITWEDYGRVRGALEALNEALRKAQKAIEDDDRDAVRHWIDRARDAKYFAIHFFPPFVVDAGVELPFSELYAAFFDADILVAGACNRIDWVDPDDDDLREWLYDALEELRRIRGLPWMDGDDDTIERLDRMIEILERAIEAVEAGERPDPSSPTDLQSEKILCLNELWDDPSDLFGERVYFELYLIDEALLDGRWLLDNDEPLEKVKLRLDWARLQKEGCLEPGLPTPPSEPIPPDQGGDDLPPRPNHG